MKVNNLRIKSGSSPVVNYKGINYQLIIGRSGYPFAVKCIESLYDFQINIKLEDDQASTIVVGSSERQYDYFLGLIKDL